MQWSKPSSHWTQLNESFALLVMKQIPALRRAGKILGLSWAEVNALRQPHVQHGLELRSLEEIEYLGVDEKDFNTKKQFITVLSDITGVRMLDVAPSKSTQAAQKIFTVIPEQKRSEVRGVTMDMTAAYETVCKLTRHI